MTPELSVVRESNPGASISKIGAGLDSFTPCRMPLESLDYPASDEIHLWHLDLGLLANSLRGALDGHTQTRYPARFTLGQLRFARRFYLRLLLGAYLDLPGKSVRINRSVRGKPVLDASRHHEQLQFSLAKSEDRVLVGFSTRCSLGVDLEPAGRRPHDSLGVARRYFSESESAALRAMPSERVDDAFLRTWACKEAVVKASGEGIANQLCRFTVETDPARPVRVLDFDGEDAGDWSLALLQPEPGFLGAVAARCAGLRFKASRLLPASAD
jgi:4'-phosphopantetheinyl transferase